jgi:hypothetical protein
MGCPGLVFVVNRQVVSDVGPTALWSASAGRLESPQTAEAEGRSSTPSCRTRFVWERSLWIDLRTVESITFELRRPEWHGAARRRIDDRASRLHAAEARSEGLAVSVDEPRDCLCLAIELSLKRSVVGEVQVEVDLCISVNVQERQHLARRL